MKVAVMQPYFFPYIGYFQLLAASDTFVFYDDVNFIKRGWINRNNILLSNVAHRITVPCEKASQNKLIKDIAVNYSAPELAKLRKSIQHAYAKAPNFESVFGLFNEVLDKGCNSIASLAGESVKAVANYLGFQKEFKYSSEQGYGNTELDRADRLIDITQKEQSETYINAIGGIDLYEKEYFSSKGVSLGFVEPVLEPYTQWGNEFVKGLSILDALMFADKEQVMEMIHKYRLV